MLFPDTYQNDQFNGIKSRADEFYMNALTSNASYWGEAYTDVRFEAGDQALWNDLYSDLPIHSRRRPFNFNYIQPITNVISGYQRRNRKSTTVIPVENADMETADQFGKVFSWIERQEGVLETLSDAFSGAIVTGMNLLHVWVDYRSDPMSGNIKVDNCAYNSFMIDPYFKKRDLSDCNGIMKRSFITKAECVSLLPNRKDEIMSISSVSGNKDGKFQYMPETLNFSDTGLLAYDEFYYKSYRKQKMLVDTQSGETMEWKNDKNERLELFLQSYPTVTMIESTIPTVRQAILLEGTVLYDGPNNLGIDQYPFVPVFAYYKPELNDFAWRVQGVVRGLRDSQYLLNRRKMIELDIFESQPNSGYIYKPGSLIDQESIFKPGQGVNIPLKQNAEMSDIQKIQPSQVPPSMFQISDNFMKMMRDISGANEELLGSAVDDKAGVLAMLRQGAGLTTLQGLFDQLDTSQKQLGKVILQVIQNNFKPGKVKRIIEQEPTQEFFNKAFGIYDVAIEEGVNTTTQRQAQFAQLLHLKDIGVPIPDKVILEATTVQNKKQIIDAMEQASQQEAQIKELQEKLAMQEQQARINLAESRAFADKGLGAERFSRIDENKAAAIENRADAVKSREIGMLNLVRSMKEIEDIDLRQIEKLINLSQMLKAEEANIQQEADAQPDLRGVVNNQETPMGNPMQQEANAQPDLRDVNQETPMGDPMVGSQ